MNTRFLTTLAAVAGTAALLAGQTGIAGDGDGVHKRHHDRMSSHQRGHHGGDMGMMHKILKRLDLTTEQRDAVHDVFEAAHPQFQTLKQARHDNQKQLTSVAPDDASYAGITDAVAQSNAELAARSTRLHAQLHADVYRLLTDDQKAQARELHAEHEARMAERRAKREERAED